MLRPTFTDLLLDWDTCSRYAFSWKESDSELIMNTDYNKMLITGSYKSKININNHQQDVTITLTVSLNDDDGKCNVSIYDNNSIKLDSFIVMYDM